MLAGCYCSLLPASLNANDAPFSLRLAERTAEGRHLNVRVSGVCEGEKKSEAGGPACPAQVTRVKLNYVRDRNEKKLFSLDDRSCPAYVVFEGEFYGPPLPDTKLPEALLKAYHPGWDYESRTKLVVHVIRSVRPAPSAKP